MSIYDAAMLYQQAGVPLVVLAGKEYGSGSSRDWAAKGTMLLGVKAVIAESFERIHRSNLVNMGVLPLQFKAGRVGRQPGPDRPRSVRADGRRRRAAPARRASSCARGRGRVDARVHARRVRIDTPEELTAFSHGGILPYVLRQLGRRRTRRDHDGISDSIDGSRIS